MRTKLLLLSLLFTGLGFSQTIDLELFAEGFTKPVEVTHAGDDRLFVVEQEGLIKIVDVDGNTAETPYLDLSQLISLGDERGLLGLAFHPDYAENGYFFVNYTNTAGNTVVARYTKDEVNPNLADPASAMIMLTVEQPDTNHNGGCLRFGPDGHLYIAMGDGGGAGDPDNNAQNINSLLGKILRLDVDAAAPHIPAGNPFIDADGADEIWAYGLRNPWKFSFNRLNGELWIADVGQGEAEEINKVSGETAGVNYGWKCYEGTLDFSPELCNEGTVTNPFTEYLHGDTSRCSITGGYAYTGETYPNLQGKYLFADLCTSEIGIVDPEGNITFTAPFTGNSFTAFGEDMNGELFIAGHASGDIFRIIDTSLSTGSFNKNGFAVYPNPANNEVFINFNDEVASASANVYDVGGKLLLQQSLERDASRIDTSMLSAGIYMLSIETEGNTYNQKLIIN